MIKGKATMFSLGVSPDVALKDARDRRAETRKRIVHDIDPSLTRKEEKAGLPPTP